MYTLVVVVHIIVCTVLVLTVLLQHGKGATMGAVFGSSETIFGSAGPATFLSKVTTGTAILFMVTSLTLTYFAAHEVTESVMEDVPVTTQPLAPEIPAPAVPEGAGPAQVDGQTSSADTGDGQTSSATGDVEPEAKGEETAQPAAPVADEAPAGAPGKEAE
jgi:preprotein translocase subunit SecG